MDTSKNVASAGARILIVEDSPTQAEQLRGLLEQHGYRVTAAATGAQALAAARKEEPALILSDIVMPEMDGYALCKAIKSDERLRDVPVILVTSLSSAGDVVKALQCGADNFIKKPYDENYLLMRVSYALTNRMLRREEKVQFGVHVSIGGERHFITADRQQILDLLISTYEEAVHVNEELKARDEQLARANLALTGLYRIAKALNIATTERDVIERVLERAMELPGVQAVWIDLREGGTGFRLAGMRGLPPELGAPGAMEGDCQCHRLLLSGELTQVTNITRCEHLRKASGDTGLAWGGHASIPLWAGDRTVGLMNLIGPQEGLFSPEELQVFNGVGHQIALALERAKLHAELERRVEERAAALRRSEERYRTLTEAAEDAIFILNREGCFEYINTAGAASHGLTADQIVGARLSDLFPAHISERLWADIQHVYATARSLRTETRIPLQGSERWFDTQLVPLKEQDGEIGTVLAIARDVTETKQLQAQVAQSDRLATMGMLAAGVAHEINNPLTYVLYNIESLSEDVPKLAEAMRRCHAALCSHIGPEAANELLAVGQDLLDPAMCDDVVARLRDAHSGTIRIKDISRALGTFSRVERTDVTPVNVRDAAEHAINMAFNEIKYRAQLVKDFRPVPMVLGSDGKLAQVFLNLLVNAAHAIKEGHVNENEIRVRTWADGDNVFVEVSDTGKGIAPEHQAKIFEPFFTTKPVGVGSGLGLSICKKIITGFGGEISFSTDAGKGTRFLVRLSRAPGDWGTRRDEVQKQIPDKPRLHGRVLVVDDEAGIRDIISRTLGRDHEVVTASSGEEGQAILENNRRFDVIFCDLMMPTMSGMELHAWIARQDPNLAERLVFITGGAFTPEAAEYLGKVQNPRVEKPFDTDGLKRITQEFLMPGEG